MTEPTPPPTDTTELESELADKMRDWEINTQAVSRLSREITKIRDGISYRRFGIKSDVVVIGGETQTRNWQGKEFRCSRINIHFSDRKPAIYAHQRKKDGDWAEKECYLGVGWHLPAEDNQ